MTRPDTARKPATEVSTMFDEVSPRYDLINDVLSAGNSRLWRVALTRALQPRKGMRILDVAAGTGTSSAALAAHGAQVTAADFSEGMLAEGRKRQAGNDLIDFVFADAMKLPFADDSFDAATISFGLRNVSEPKRALAEMRRVVRPGGRIVVCEFSRPAKALRAPYSVYSRYVLPRIAGVLNREAEEAYRYLNESIELWPAQDELAAWLREAELERVAYRNLTFGIVALHRGFVPAAKPVVAEPASVREKPAKKESAAEKDPGPGAVKAPATKAPVKKTPAKGKQAAAEKAPAKKAQAKKSPTKATSKSPAKSAPAKSDAAKPAAKKAPAAKKPAAKKPTAKSTSKQSAPTKAAPKQSTAKSAPTKAAPKKPAAKQPAARKPAAKPSKPEGRDE